MPDRAQNAASCRTPRGWRRDLEPVAVDDGIDEARVTRRERVVAEADALGALGRMLEKYVRRRR